MIDEATRLNDDGLIKHIKKSYKDLGSVVKVLAELSARIIELQESSVSADDVRAIVRETTQTPDDSGKENNASES